MGSKTAIAWTDSTWNAIRGCTRVSEGCTRCYAEAVAGRFSAPGQPYHGVAVLKVIDGTHRGRWTGKIEFVKEHLEDPLRWRRPRRIFVNSMSDLFHENIKDEWIDDIVAVMALSSRHNFQVLTKRPERMRDYLIERSTATDVHSLISSYMNRHGAQPTCDMSHEWPAPHIWWGVSAEDQKTTDERIPLLLQTPAAVRWVSYEPAIGPIDFTAIHRTRAEGFMRPLDGRFNKLNWIVVGGESGPDARPFDIQWARDTISQCENAGTACFVKQLGKDPYDSAQPGRPHLKVSGKGDDWKEWPADLRVREYPVD